MILLENAAAAFFGTMAFSLLFSVPRKYYPACGLIGMLGWMVYLLLLRQGMGTDYATFLATVAVLFCSRTGAVIYRCPVTTFLLTGIFPLVPGGGIYWTAYYLVTSQLHEALSSGVTAIRCVVAIVLGIVVVLEIPGGFFRWLGRWIPQNGRPEKRPEKGSVS